MNMWPDSKEHFMIRHTEVDKNWIFIWRGKGKPAISDKGSWNNTPTTAKTQKEAEKVCGSSSVSSMYVSHRFSQIRRGVGLWWLPSACSGLATGVKSPTYSTREQQPNLLYMPQPFHSSVCVCVLQSVCGGGGRGAQPHSRRRPSSDVYAPPLLKNPIISLQAECPVSKQSL